MSVTAKRSAPKRTPSPRRSRRTESSEGSLPLFGEDPQPAAPRPRARVGRGGRAATTLALGATATVTGTISYVLWADKGFAIVRVRTDEGKTVTAKGTLGTVATGQHIVLHGEWVTDPRYGEQLKVSYVERSIASGPDGIKRFLQMKVSGIGEKTAQEIVDRFGERTFEVLENDPAALSEIAGIGPGRAKQILAAWKREKDKGGHETLAFLLQLGLGEGMAQRVYQRYGDGAETTLRENPYILMDQVEGFGFKRSDDVAQHLGVPADSPFRIRAGILFALNEAAQSEGHCYLPKVELLTKAAEALGVAVERIGPELPYLAERGEVVIEDDAVYAADLHRSELAVAERLRALIGAAETMLPDGERDELIAATTRQLKIQPSEQQLVAVRTALSQRLAVITGGPGTGKTTIVRTLCRILDRLDRGYVLLSPTGKAAKRLSEVTGNHAATLHRYLREVDPSGRGSIPAEVVIIDEVSMMDINLAAWVLRRVTPKHRIIFLGDIDQLPSVGPGSFLRDLISAQVVPVVRLHEVFRQALDSGIISNAHRINTGEFPRSADDFEIVIREDAAEIAELVRATAARERAIVLTPQRSTPLGVTMLNNDLQGRLNPARSGVAETRHGQIVFRVGDPVIVGRNDYDKMVFNGEVGEVVAATPQGIEVRIDGRDVIFLQGDIARDRLSLCYALTIHKAQGSEYGTVIVPCVKQHYTMLARNLLYTAVTRARTRVVLVGQRQAIYMAIKNDRITARYSRLADRLRTASVTAGDDILF